MELQTWRLQILLIVFQFLLFWFEILKMVA